VGSCFWFLYAAAASVPRLMRPAMAMEIGPRIVTVKESTKAFQVLKGNLCQEERGMQIETDLRVKAVDVLICWRGEVRNLKLRYHDGIQLGYVDV
jgi:hypothetical protein